MMFNKALIILFLLAVGSYDIVYACQCVETDKAVLFEKAEHVFFAEITDTKLVKMKSDPSYPKEVDVVEAKFRVLEVFKGNPQQVGSVRDLSFGFGNCSIGLMSGLEYILFVTKGEPPLTNYVHMCTGSMAVNTGYNEFQKLLDEYRNLGKKVQKSKTTSKTP